MTDKFTYYLQKLSREAIARGLSANRRWFMKKALAVAGATSAGARLFRDNNSGPINKGCRDAPFRRRRRNSGKRFLDPVQRELGGIQDSEVAGGHGIPAYTTALQNLDSDFPQYMTTPMTKSHTLPS